MSGCGCSRTDSLCIEHAALFLTAQTTLLHATTSFSFECDYCRERLASLQLLDRHKLKHQIAARLHFRAKRQQRQLQRRQLQQETGAAQSHLQSSTTESTPVESPQALSTQLQSSALRGQNTQPENDFGPRVKATIQPDPPKPTGLTFGFPDSDSDSSSTMPKSRPRPGSFTGPAAQPSPAVLDIGGKRIKKQLAEFVGPDGQVEPEEPQQDPLPVGSAKLPLEASHQALHPDSSNGSTKVASRAAESPKPAPSSMEKQPSIPPRAPPPKRKNPEVSKNAFLDELQEAQRATVSRHITNQQSLVEALFALREHDLVQTRCHERLVGFDSKVQQSQILRLQSSQGEEKADRRKETKHDSATHALAPPRAATLYSQYPSFSKHDSAEMDDYDPALLSTTLPYPSVATVQHPNHVYAMRPGDSMRQQLQSRAHNDPSLSSSSSAAPPSNSLRLDNLVFPLSAPNGLNPMATMPASAPATFMGIPMAPAHLSTAPPSAPGYPTSIYAHEPFRKDMQHRQHRAQPQYQLPQHQYMASSPYVTQPDKPQSYARYPSHAAHQQSSPMRQARHPHSAETQQSHASGSSISRVANGMDDVGSSRCVCGRPSAFLCSQCRQQTYCSANCQTSHWTQHADQCRAPPPTVGPPQVYQRSLVKALGAPRMRGPYCCFVFLGLCFATAIWFQQAAVTSPDKGSPCAPKTKFALICHMFLLASSFMACLRLDFPSHLRVQLLLPFSLRSHLAHLCLSSQLNRPAL
eukprot:m.201632 g.201632  ORF g.201632 m.201632 type:complete len:750 (+) comp53832_c0_seq3:250-2499(+)